jgi:hypothetical protein
MYVTPTPTTSTYINNPTPTFPLTTPTSTPVVNHDNLRGDLPHNRLTETIKVYARPTITHISHLHIPQMTSYDIMITGYSMNYTTSVYLSSNYNNIQSEYIDVYNDIRYPAISACEAQFKIISENELIITIPPVSGSCLIDVIIMNPAGYGSIQPTYDIDSNVWSEYNLQHGLINIK